MRSTYDLNTTVQITVYMVDYGFGYLKLLILLIITKLLFNYFY